MTNDRLLTPDQRCAIAATLVEGYCLYLNTYWCHTTNGLFRDDMDDDDDDDTIMLVGFIKRTLMSSVAFPNRSGRLLMNAYKMKALLEDESQRDISVKVLDYFKDIGGDTETFRFFAEEAEKDRLCDLDDTITV